MIRLPAGLLVSVAKVSDPCRSWKPHRLRRDVDAVEYRTEDVFGSSGALIVRENDWLILTRWNHVHESPFTPPDLAR